MILKARIGTGITYNVEELIDVKQTTFWLSYLAN